MKQQNNKQPINIKTEATSEKRTEVKNTNTNSAKNETGKKHNPNHKKPNFNNNKNVKSEWEADIQKALHANTRVNKQRLTTYNKYKTDKKVWFTPLGGLGEIGGNISIFETEDSAFIIDVGMSFPDETMHGVDILIPDFSYIRQIKHKIKAVIITHGHEDHIGAIAYLFKEMQFPIYATPLPLTMIANKFDEHKLSQYKSLFHPIEKRKAYKVGDFEIEWVHVTHSIIDCSCLAIKTPAGYIFHTGDFKIDHSPVDNLPTDLHRIAQYGEKGILCLFSDSTNSYKEGFTKSEKTVGPTLDKIFSESKGRVIMSTFSSNTHRVYQAIEYGIKYGRKIAVIGRSMDKNLNIALDLGYIKIDKKHFIDAHEVGRYADDKILIVTTGSQGEPMSALYRMATNEHRHIKLKPTDKVVLSAKAIPGNEASVSGVMNLIMKLGATVAYQDYDNIHVSGHAAIEEQKLMIRLTKPKFFLPVHGEYNHIARHKKTGILCGVDEKNIQLMSDGDQMEITTNYIKKVKTIKTGKHFVDNQNNLKIEDHVIYDRQKLAENGIINILVQLDEEDLSFCGAPEINTIGLVSNYQQNKFQKEVENMITVVVTSMAEKGNNNAREIEQGIKQSVKKYTTRRMRKFPIIIVQVVML